MLACNPVTGEVRRYLTAPTNCEVTGVTWAPDGRTMFLNIQPPGETPIDRSDPPYPTRFSNWPDFQPGGRPRSATVVVRRADGGVLGSCSATESPGLSRQPCCWPRLQEGPLHRTPYA
jgi:hypothetical protein